ncbi:hypothetical protein PFHG_04759 [Plasmodium falciparum HB3]|uniref:Uncharacterized protein n=1 Tax=Plasmodium falciparum (isolate HB3) TaxID=137071 RepID=A0A0L7KI06_PLAFX|nr:hypothetical protein PFHG_04759 [Plasmodium falciparum HB3]
MSESSALSTSVKDTNKCDSSNCDKEELVDINKSFINIEEENTKDITNYLKDKISFMKRIETFKAWGEIILWNISIFDLDKKSLTKEELLKEYEDNIVSLKNNLLFVPLINIKKTLHDLIFILKKFLENNMNKKRFSIFDHYVKIFKEEYIHIFLNNKNIIDKGIEIIKNKYPLYEKYIVDINYLNNINFNMNNVTSFINILSDICLDDSFCDEQDDINMYFKIVQKLKNYQYENVNIFKLLALFGWSYKSPQDDEHTQILQSK